jgi:hypothetical protein
LVLLVVEPIRSTLTPCADERQRRSERRPQRPIRKNGAVSVTRVAWIATVVVALITGLLLLLGGYNGYAGLGLAVAVAAAINLL